MSGNHVPVLRNEAVEALSVIPGRLYIDATLGAAGHTTEILKRGGRVLGIDQDESAIAIASHNPELTPFAGNYTFVHGNFRDIEAIANAQKIGKVAGILFDLGISSMQLDSPDRGISYRFTDAPLDVRMDTSGGDTAAQLVNRESRERLYDIFSTFGEEQLAGVIADAIVSARSVKHIETVGDLTAIIERLVPSENARFGVLSRVFQALRIAINDELGSLKSGLAGAYDLLEPRGKLVVISFHSLEDRIVKQFMRSDKWEHVTKHPVRPGDEETEHNKRARSAKLRAATKK